MIPWHMIRFWVKYRHHSKDWHRWLSFTNSNWKEGYEFIRIVVWELKLSPTRFSLALENSQDSTLVIPLSDTSKKRLLLKSSQLSIRRKPSAIVILYSYKTEVAPRKWRERTTVTGNTWNIRQTTSYCWLQVDCLGSCKMSSKNNKKEKLF